MIDRTPPQDFIHQLARLVNTIRPEWELLHVVAALESAEQREPIVTPGQFAATAVNVACERRWRTPKAIAFDGDHWPAGARAVGAVADRGPACLECGRSEGLCRRADAQVEPSDRHEFRSTR